MPELELIKLARASWTPLGIAALVLILLYLVSKLALRVSQESSEPALQPAGSGGPYSPPPPAPPPKPSGLAQVAERIFSRFWILAIVVACLAFAAYALPSFFSDTNLRGV